MANGSFFTDPAAELNQGDIIDNVPWGLIEAPTTLCRPNNRQAPSGKAFYGTVSELKQPAPWTHEPEFVHGIGWGGLVIVLWHGCQLDKWKNRDKETGQNTHETKAFAGIAPVVPLEGFQPAEQRDDVRQRKHHSLFPLPAAKIGTRDLPESYVDLRHIWPVRQQILAQRLCSLGDTARLSLYEHLFTFFTRFRLDFNPTCPSCGTVVPLEPAQEVIEEEASPAEEQPKPADAPPS